MLFRSVRIFGGDTVRSSGPFHASLTLMGWTPAGTMIRRSGAVVGDLVLVSGTIGDGSLGLIAARGDATFSTVDRAWLADRYRRPQPRTGIEAICRRWCSSAADVSDGLLADAGHVGKASNACLRIDLEQLPLSPAAERWLATQPEPGDAVMTLATGGDDYEIVCTASKDASGMLIEEASRCGVTFQVIGTVVAGSGSMAVWHGQPVRSTRTGWSHIR